MKSRPLVIVGAITVLYNLLFFLISTLVLNLDLWESGQDFHRESLVVLFSNGIIWTLTAVFLLTVRQTLMLETLLAQIHLLFVNLFYLLTIIGLAAYAVHTTLPKGEIQQAFRTLDKSVVLYSNFGLAAALSVTAVAFYQRHFRWLAGGTAFAAGSVFIFGVLHDASNFSLAGLIVVLVMPIWIVLVCLGVLSSSK